MLEELTTVPLLLQEEIRVDRVDMATNSEFFGDMRARQYWW